MSKTGARILVVDDEIEIMRALQRSLTAHGFEVFTAGSGEEALDAILQHRPDLMVLDLGLPGMSGLEVCRRVRAQSNLPIIVLSVKDTERDKVRHSSGDRTTERSSWDCGWRERWGSSGICAAI
jgi:two-component system, OmpR family, KDP operon response regulator KdpE